MQKTFYNGRVYSLYKGYRYFQASKSPKFKYRRLHQQVYFDNFGEIPKGFDVHHADENPLNNTPGNLELLEKINHCKLHMQKRAKENPEQFKTLAAIGQQYAKAWHGSEEGLKWHKQHAKEIGLGQFPPEKRECLNCNKTFIATSNRSTFCSNSCKSQHRRRQGTDNEERKCSNCQQSFICNKYSKAKCCSKSCAAIFRNK